MWLICGCCVAVVASWRHTYRAITLGSDRGGGVWAKAALLPTYRATVLPIPAYDAGGWSRPEDDATLCTRVTKEGHSRSEEWRAVGFEALVGKYHGGCAHHMHSAVGG